MNGWYVSYSKVYYLEDKAIILWRVIVKGVIEMSTNVSIVNYTF
jgi:hypothetical protein